MPRLRGTLLPRARVPDADRVARDAALEAARGRARRRPRVGPRRGPPRGDDGPLLPRGPEGELRAGIAGRRVRRVRRPRRRTRPRAEAREDVPPPAQALRVHARLRGLHGAPGRPRRAQARRRVEALPPREVRRGPVARRGRGGVGGHGRAAGRPRRGPRRGGAAGLCGARARRLVVPAGEPDVARGARVRRRRRADAVAAPRHGRGVVGHALRRQAPPAERPRLQPRRLGPLPLPRPRRRGLVGPRVLAPDGRRGRRPADLPRAVLVLGPRQGPALRRRRPPRARPAEDHREPRAARARQRDAVVEARGLPHAAAGLRLPLGRGRRRGGAPRRVLELLRRGAREPARPRRGPHGGPGPRRARPLRRLPARRGPLPGRRGLCRRRGDARERRQRARPRDQPDARAQGLGRAAGEQALPRRRGPRPPALRGPVRSEHSGRAEAARFPRRAPRRAPRRGQGRCATPGEVHRRAPAQRRRSAPRDLGEPAGP